MGLDFFDVEVFDVALTCVAIATQKTIIVKDINLIHAKFFIG